MFVERLDVRGQRRVAVVAADSERIRNRQVTRPGPGFDVSPTGASASVFNTETDLLMEGAQLFEQLHNARGV
jgi:hypothetical protein